MFKTLVILSGGMDSTVLAFMRHAENKLAGALSFNYGQRHRKELEYAERVAKHLGVRWDLVDLSTVGPLLRSSQTDETIDVPEGHYAEESMKATFVPNRNMMMLSVAAAVAISRDLRLVGYAAHSGDHAIYPDCRPSFVDAMNRAIREGNWTGAEIDAPFIGIPKHDIVSLGASLGVPFEMTWSCYKGKDAHCGRCGTCVERREAFDLARIKDPTQYDFSS